MHWCVFREMVFALDSKRALVIGLGKRRDCTEVCKSWTLFVCGPVINMSFHFGTRL